MLKSGPFTMTWRTMLWVSCPAVPVTVTKWIPVYALMGAVMVRFEKAIRPGERWTVLLGKDVPRSVETDRVTVPLKLLILVREMVELTEPPLCSARTCG